MKAPLFFLFLLMWKLRLQDFEYLLKVMQLENACTEIHSQKFELEH